MVLDTRGQRGFVVFKGMCRLNQMKKGCKGRKYINKDMRNKYGITWKISMVGTYGICKR